MRIYIFAEHYPTPYKPQLDTEFAYLIRAGHEVRIFAAGSFSGAVHPRVVSYRLATKTTYLPAVVSQIPRFAIAFLQAIFRNPLMSFWCAYRVSNVGSIRDRLLRTVRAVLSGPEAPHVVYIHNIASYGLSDYTQQLYPLARQVLYFHGGEVGGVKRITRDKECFARMDCVITNTRFSKEQAVSRGSQRESTHVVPVGFDVSDYVPEPRKGSPCERSILLVSRMSPEKGVVYMISALRRLLDDGVRARLRIIGMGLEFDRLKKHSRNLGLAADVEFLGEMEKPQVVEQLKRADVLVLPSLTTDTWAETQGAVLQEAMFMRVPVVATLTGGIPEAVAPCYHQFLVPPGSEAQIAAAISRIFSLSSEERELLLDEGRRFVLDRFDIERTGPTIESLLLCGAS